jgi:hypothetical protein
MHPVEPEDRTDSDCFMQGRAHLLIGGSLIMPMHRQVDKPGWGMPEAAGIEVERRQVLLEVDVEPLATCRGGMPDCMTHQSGANALPLMLPGDLGIEEEGVIASVPRHVDKADQAAATLQPSGHPAKAVGPDLVPPPGRGLAAMCSDKGHYFRVGDWSAPAILNRLG